MIVLVAAQVDSLSHCQRMVLKVASILGETFTFVMIQAGYPIEEHHPILFREYQGLLQRSILRTVVGRGADKRHSLPSADYHDLVTSQAVAFSSVFLMEFVRSRILNRQVKHIAMLVTRSHVRNRERVVLYSGPMSICKESSRRRFLGRL